VFLSTSKAILFKFRLISQTILLRLLSISKTIGVERHRYSQSPDYINSRPGQVHPHYISHCLGVDCKDSYRYLDRQEFKSKQQNQAWMKKATKTKALIICGPGGWGKTRLAEAICHHLCGRYHFISRPDQTRDMIFMPDEALVWDEVSGKCYAIVLSSWAHS
jgi:hypothetical protein